MNQITFGDQRLQTPDQFYRSIFPGWQNLSYQYPSPSGLSDDWWNRGQSVRPGGPTATIDPSPSPVVPRDRATAINKVTFGDQRLQTPDQFYRSIFPGWQNLSYQYPSPVGGSDSWWGRGQSVRPNQVTFGDQLPLPSGQYPSPVGESDSWWGRGQSVRLGGPTATIDPSPSPVVPRDRAIVLYSPSQQAASAARTRQAYAAGMDDYFPGLTGLEPPGKMPNASASAKGFTAGGRIAPGTIAHSLTNLGPVDALFSLGSAPFTYANYKSFGATNPQALAGTIGTEGGGVLGGLAGARLGATVGSIFGPMGATGGAILGAVVGGQAGFRLGAKAADELSGLNEANRVKQQQQFYDPAANEVYMPPAPPTPQERMRNEILLSAQNPYMPYMMAQLGGYYA